MKEKTNRYVVLNRQTWTYRDHDPLGYYTCLQNRLAQLVTDTKTAWHVTFNEFLLHTIELDIFDYLKNKLAN
jgi:hypothetical protein